MICRHSWLRAQASLHERMHWTNKEKHGYKALSSNCITTLLHRLAQSDAHTFQVS